MADLMSGILAWYCRQFHPRRWPISGGYLCPRCLRKRPVKWEAKAE